MGGCGVGNRDADDRRAVRHLRLLASSHSDGESYTQHARLDGEGYAEHAWSDGEGMENFKRRGMKCASGKCTIELRAAITPPKAAAPAMKRTVMASSSSALFRFKKPPLYNRGDGYMIGYNVHLFKKDGVTHAVLVLGI